MTIHSRRAPSLPGRPPGRRSDAEKPGCDGSRDLPSSSEAAERADEAQMGDRVAHLRAV